MELLQVRSELDPVLDIYRELNVKRVLEIGSWDGGTIREWLTNGPAQLVVAAVDLEHRNRDAYDEWRKPKQTVVLYIGDSQQQPAKDFIAANGPYEFALIDGDHGLDAVRSDYEAVLPHMSEGGVIALHDIDGGEGFGADYGPGVLLREIEETGLRVARFIDPTPMGWAHGLGLVWT